MRRDRGGDIKTMIAEGPAPAAGARNRGVLTLLSGAEVGRVIAIRPGVELKLGRSDDCQVRFEDASLSRVHASIMVVAGASFVLKDEGSTNGSFVNETRLTAARELRDGDRIQLGSSTLMRFQIVDEAEETALMRVFDAGRQDGLTGIPNRKAFDERLDTEYAYAVRHQTPLCLIMMDVDFFKKINDGHGHPAGDAVLKAVAAALTRGIRTEDSIARYGGEEFAVIARGIELFGACLMADRLRMAVSKEPVAFAGKSIPVTMSAGAASLECCGPRPDKAALVSLADTRLYKAKQTGRNRVVGPD